MVDLKNVHSLTDFSRNAKKHLKRLKKTGEPEVLTVNGNAEAIVQSSEGYQQLMEDAELSRSLRIIRKGIEEIKAGKGIPMREFIESLAAEYGIDLG